MKLFQSGVFIDMQYPYLGASPGRIQVCTCCIKTLLEVKGIFNKKKNVQPHVGAAHCLDEVAGK